jgi:hypothetical protein
MGLFPPRAGSLSRGVGGEKPTKLTKFAAREAETRPMSGQQVSRAAETRQSLVSPPSAMSVSHKDAKGEWAGPLLAVL